MVKIASYVYLAGELGLNNINRGTCFEDGITLNIIQVDLHLINRYP